MPFCCQCGKPVGDADLYCRACGAGQRPEQPRPAAPQFSNMSPRTASILCYIPFIGWIAAIVVLASDKYRRERKVRFHAFQALYLFVAWLIVRWVIRPIPYMLPGPHFSIDGILQLAIWAVCIYMVVKVSQDQFVSLPVIGDLAEKSVSES